MNAIYNNVITDASAWTAASSSGGEAFRRQLTGAELNAFEELMAKTDKLAPQAVTQSQFTHPNLDGLINGLRSELMDGSGISILTGITPARFSEEQMQRIYWGLGTHLGNAAVQSASGDRLGFVEADPTNAVGRGYRSDRELILHTDSYELVGLMCIRSAATGGESRLASSLAIHNEILRTKPHLLAPLYRGYYISIREGKLSTVRGPDKYIPAFCLVDGKVSCNYNRGNYERAAEDRSVPLPADFHEAMAYLDELANDDRFNIEFLLEPGEIMLFHNFTALHARRSFKDSETKRRLLLRLWLNVPNGRPMIPEFYERALAYDRIQREAREAAKQPA